MLKYLIIQLDDSSASFCHYPHPRTAPRLMPLDTLKNALLWSMKENLSVQILYPDYEIPAEYREAIDTVDHSDIVSATCADKALKDAADVVIFDKWTDAGSHNHNEDQSYAIRTTFADMLAHKADLKALLLKISRVNVTLTDLPRMTDDEIRQYSDYLDDTADAVKSEYERGHAVQLNLLTDRIFLDKMNNCNAGDESIALCPDGKFYICPAFYADGACVGDLASGIDIKNPQLYKLSHAPICRICDAFQCRRCVWLNSRMTLEVNTPSREQCILSHIERNASRKFLVKIRQIGSFMPDKDIPELDYLDPFNKIAKHS